MKAVIVSLPANDSPEALPLGAACVVAALNADAGLRGRLEASVLEGALGEGPEALASRIASTGAAFVGFSVYAWSRSACAGAARLLRARLPGAVLFAGGPEATADPPGLLAQGGFDFAVAGEGESASVSALRDIIAAGASSPLPEALARRLAALPGIALPGRPHRRAPAEDPASLPSPWLSGAISPAGRGGELVWELARGCPYRCAYCYESKGEPGVRRLPMRRIEAELALFVRSGARYVFVLDPTFNADRERARQTLELMRREGRGIRWKLELRAELLDQSTVDRLSRLDCALQVGLQSSRPETLALVGRGFDAKAFARGLGLLDRSGLSFGLDLIYGLPGDGLADFERSVDYALGFGPNHLDVFPLSVLPGTELFERAAELGLEAEAAPPYRVKSTRQLGADGLAEAASLAAACDRFYSAGRAVGWFRAALAPLRERPSALLKRYAALYLGDDKALARAASKAGHAAIEAEQLAFLERSYLGAGQERLWPALSGLVRLHGALSRAAAEGESTELELDYDCDELLAAAPASLPAFVRAAGPRRGRVRVVPDDAEGAAIVRLGGRPRLKPSGRGRPDRSPPADPRGARSGSPRPPRKDRATRR